MLTLGENERCPVDLEKRVRGSAETVISDIAKTMDEIASFKPPGRWYVGPTTYRCYTIINNYMCHTS